MSKPQDSRVNQRRAGSGVAGSVCALVPLLTSAALAFANPGIANDVLPVPGGVMAASKPGIKQPIDISMNYSSGKAVPREALHVLLDDVEITSGCFFNSSTVRCAALAELAPGRHTVNATVGEMRKSWTFEAAPAPEILELSPASGTHYASEAQPLIHLVFCNSRPVSSLSKDADISLTFDKIEVGPQAFLAMTTELCGSVDFKPKTPLAVGNHLFHVQIRGVHGLLATRTTNFVIDPPAEYVLRLISPEEGTVVHDADIKVGVTATSNRSLPDEVTVNGVLATVSSFAQRPWTYEALIHLEPGSNDLEVQVKFEDGQSRTLHKVLRYETNSTRK